MEIINYPNYLIYDDGRVYSKKRNIFLKPRFNNSGYKTIHLCNNGKHKHLLIHRLVGLHYLEKVEGKNQIDHIDRDKTNNHISNLRWCNNTENNINKGHQSNNKLGLKNISKTKFNTYIFQLKRNGKHHSKSFKTLEECIEYRDRYLDNGLL
jgi:hypothetical protein